MVESVADVWCSDRRIDAVVNLYAVTGRLMRWQTVIAVVDGLMQFQMVNTVADGWCNGKSRYSNRWLMRWQTVGAVEVRLRQWQTVDPVSKPRHFHQEKKPFKGQHTSDGEPVDLHPGTMNMGTYLNCAGIGTIKTHLLGPFWVLVLPVSLKQGIPRIVCLGWKPSIADYCWHCCVGGQPFSHITESEFNLGDQVHK